MSFDIFNPQVSVVAKGLEGKVITIVGSNSLGKTKQASRMERPFYLGFEKGLRAIAGVPFLPINKWSDFKKINKQLTDSKTLEKAKELYQTIIFDEVYTSSLYCQDYVAKLHGEKSIGDGNNGFGLWKEYEKEYWEEIDKLLNSGYTLIFISHEDDLVTGEGKNKKVKKVPKGDKRSIKPVIDNSDVVLYLTSNGVDENNKVIKSSAWTAETEFFFARSRFDYIDTVIPEFTAENLEKAIIEAIERQEKAEGIQAVDYEEQVKSLQSEVLDFESLKEQCAAKLSELVESGEHEVEDLLDLVGKHLGKGTKVSETKPHQAEFLSLLLEDLKSL